MRRKIFNAKGYNLIIAMYSIKLIQAKKDTKIENNPILANCFQPYFLCLDKQRNSFAESNFLMSNMFQ